MPLQSDAHPGSTPIVNGARKRAGAFTISLDLELYWGVRDKVGLDTYGSKILGARRAIPEILDLFEGHGVNATWAAVGFLFFDDKDELLAHLPPRRPSYANQLLSPYEHVLGVGRNEREDPYHFGRSLLRRILQCPGQEIGTHTFSHYYCLEEGQTLDEFRADLRAADAAARLLGIELKSLVFPRNQWRPDYLRACADVGIEVIRGNEASWLYKPGTNSLTQRALRLVDAYVNISGQHGQEPSRLGLNVIDVPASRFLRPFSSVLAALDPVRVRRIYAGMKHAAEYGLVYHLWWHPHNFGAHLEENLAVLQSILGHFRQLSERHGMISKSMGEFVDDDVSS